MSEMDDFDALLNIDVGEDFSDFDSELYQSNGQGQLDYARVMIREGKDESEIRAELQKGVDVLGDIASYGPLLLDDGDKPRPPTERDVSRVIALARRREQ